MSDNKCSTQGCDSHSQGQSSHQCSCGCGGQCKCGCGSQSKCGSGQDDKCHFTKELVELADHAWMCVLAEKVKERIKVSSGQSLDELAKIIVDANGERWKLKMAKKRDCHEFEEKIEQFFHKKQ